MSYQRGDRFVSGQGGGIYQLRLTFGALAQVCDVLAVDSFSALAEQMRNRPKEAISVFANAMLSAAGCEAEVEAADLPKLSEVVSDLVSAAFNPLSRSPLRGELSSVCETEGVLKGASPPQSFSHSSKMPAPPSRGSGAKNQNVSPAPPIPFTSWLKIAVQIYRLSPSEFWPMSLSDFFALLPEPQTPTGRENLSQMMKQFPDEAPK